MEKNMRVRMLAAYGVLTLIAEIVADAQRPDHEVIAEIRDLLHQVDDEEEEK